ncbi:MAG: GNAT family N-acetyltransferase [Candidatus Comchoanobacterales bacterium]
MQNNLPIIEVRNGFNLRPFKHSDAEDYQSILKHPSVAPFIPSSCIPSSTSDAIREIFFIQSEMKVRRKFLWALENQNGQLIGSAGIETWNEWHKRAEIVYELHPDYWGQGLMTEAIKRVMEYAYFTLKAVRIEAFTLVNNPASTALLQRLHFTQEAVLSKYRFFNGQHVDIIIYAHTQAN